MKKIMFLFIVIISTLSCNQKSATVVDDTMISTDSSTTTKTTTPMEDTKSIDKNSKLYACPMHPEVQGNLNDECPKCGMKLTEPVPVKNN